MLPITLPRIGPVQENDTITRVSAMKKIPIPPLKFEALSTLLARPLGKVISKKPKKQFRLEESYSALPKLWQLQLPMRLLPLSEFRTQTSEYLRVTFSTPPSFLVTIRVWATVFFTTIPTMSTPPSFRIQF